MLVEAAVSCGCSQFIYLSTLSVYGPISTAVVDEKTPLSKPDLYGATKLEGERRIASHQESFSSIALRLPGVIGRGAHGHWLYGVATALIEGRTLTAFNLDAPFNNACHVTDLARFVASLCGRDWRGFDAVVLGARGMVTVREAIERLAKAMDVTSSINEVEAPQDGFTLSSDRAICHWGYDPMEIGTMIDQYGAEL